MFRRVAIIGGGAAGASLLSELLSRRTGQPLHLDWYTGGDAAPGRGVAYATRSERHLLNVRAASMGMFAHRPNGFLEYARRGDPAIAATDFLPRRLYGDYLEAETAGALAQAGAHGHDVHMLPFAVQAVVPEADGVTVFHGDSETRVEAVVLALGTLPPQPLPGVAEATLADGRYVVEPWRFLAGAVDDAAPREVAVLGLGLTAVDVLLELAARWPQARFTAVSRHGRLPEAHNEQPAVPPEDADTLPTAMLDAPSVRIWLRQLREACAPLDDWRAVLDSLRPHTPALWAALPDEERARFLRHLRWAWERTRHRMPPAAADGIRALEREGRLRLLRGRLRTATADAGGLRLELAHAGRALPPLHADLAIQTTGMDFDVRRTPHPLVRQLLTNGHIESDPLGLGWRADADGRLLHDGRPWSRLFAIGGLLRGTLWETTAMPEIRQQARQLADRMLGEGGRTA
ncbi:FAD/NAD(P)-binding protein [Fulvimonas sp. R45]|uniref:FAD/NAD(P)-binding protein n=1 Tax=Fulvimonas sp. R45 TaxID=3045937 RepID=UPI00265F44FF|nr:FAD/NAD(P)-binding protein [Fulvimonas sp. R45]MDO1528404.1 FAD/NAD(P)-binding protein [Fulvimonas sp. R45]